MRSLRNVWSCNIPRHLGLIAVCAGIVASVGCDGGKLTAPDPPSSDPPSSAPSTSVRVEFGGRVVNADSGGPVGNVRVSLGVISYPGRLEKWEFPKDTATSGEDGTFTLPLTLLSVWRFVSLELTAPPGYDDAGQRYDRVGASSNPSGPTAADRPAIRMYPTLVITPGESIEVRVDSDIVWCGFDGVPCRRVMVTASSGNPVELEVVSHDSSKPMAVGLAIPLDVYILEPDMSVRRLIVPSGVVSYVLGAGTATLTARAEQDESATKR